MITVKNLYKSFNNKVVLEDISTEFLPGKCNMIIGASGSGKTVMIKCMVGLIDADQGEILYQNKDFSKMNYKEKKNQRQEIGMLFQYSALFDSLNIFENVAFPLRIFSQKTKAEINDRVEFCLTRVNLDPKQVKNKFPDEISGGMKKRVGIARAIVLNPKYLYCDEPNSGLDPLTAHVIDELISEITQEFNTTTIINTHDMNSVMKYGDKIVYLYQGKLRFDGTPNEIKNTQDKNIRDFVYASQFT
jgi:phospholipid/cholesterol/gamma-HCH transport system ATP-binding protein